MSSLKRYACKVNISARLLMKCKSKSEISKWLCLCFGLLYLSLSKVSNVFAFTLETNNNRVV